MATISEALAIAIRHHHGGRLQAAEQIYRQILQVTPSQADAIHLLGTILHERGNLEEAAACYRRVLELLPDFAEAHYNLGNVLKTQRKVDEAAACYRRAVKLRPGFAQAHYNLGVALRDLGKPDEAVICWRRAVELNPDYTRAYSNLGVILREQGKPDEAIACWRRALELKPDFAEAHSNLGNAWKDQGNIDEAVACYRQALELQPGFVEARMNLGIAFKDRGMLEEAVACYRRVLELQPELATAHNNLGVALTEQGKLNEGLTCYRRAVELQPDFAGAHNNLGNALKAQGNLEGAIVCYHQALELQPDFADVYYNLGTVYQDQGKLDEAVRNFRQVAACCRQILSHRPRSAEIHNSLGKALSQLAFILGSRLPEDELIAMRQSLAEPLVCGDSRIALEFGLARALDAAGDYHEAAEHLREANALRSAHLRARGKEYQPANVRGFVDSLIATFTPRFFSQTTGFGLESDLPVFVFGLPRSGTTLVEQVLASHSQVFGAGEITLCDETFEFLPEAMHRNDAPLQCLPALDGATARHLAQRHMDRLQGLDKRALRIVDKLPDNYHFLGLISILFPRARLIHCRRDLRDVALSCWMTDFASVAWACDTDQIASHFEEYRRLMNHWRQVLPLPLLDVDYEELVKDPEGDARRIVAWCGLEWEPGCLKFYETPRPVRTASAVQVRQPIYTTSVGRWRNYETWLSEMFSRVARSDWSESPRTG